MPLYTRFPNLRNTGFQFTSPETGRYNCIAWAAGDITRFWWPNPVYYWPDGLPKEETVESFLNVFAIFGFEPCTSASLEAGFEKVALYCDADGIPSHMARQLMNGTWTSKLGSSYDITHPTLEGVEGQAYGSVCRILKRHLTGGEK